MLPAVHHKQYELARGTTHWIAWFSNAQLIEAAVDGWHVLEAYPNTILVLNDHGRLNGHGRLIEMIE